MTVTIDGVAIEDIIDVSFSEAKLVSKPRYVNQDFRLDTNVWSRYAIQITYQFYATNSLKNSLMVILKKHLFIHLYDDIYGMDSGDAFMKKMKCAWEGRRDWSKPWLITLFIIIDTPLLEFTPPEGGDTILYEDFENWNENGWTAENNYYGGQSGGTQQLESEGWIDFGNMIPWYMYFKPFEGTYARRFKSVFACPATATIITSETTSLGGSWYSQGDAPYVNVTADENGVLTDDENNYIYGSNVNTDCELKCEIVFGGDANYASSATLYIKGRTTEEGLALGRNRVFVKICPNFSGTCANCLWIGYAPAFTNTTGWTTVTLDLTAVFQTYHYQPLSSYCILIGSGLGNYFSGAISAVWISAQPTAISGARIRKDLVPLGSNYYNALTIDLRFFAFNAVGAIGEIMWAWGDDYSDIFRIYLDSSGYLHMYFIGGESGSIDTQLGTKKITYDRWNFLRVYYDCSYGPPSAQEPENGHIQVWLNGTLIYDYTGGTTNYNGIGFESIAIGLTESFTWGESCSDLWIWFDKIAVYAPLEEAIDKLYSIDTALSRKIESEYLTDLLLKGSSPKTYGIDIWLGGHGLDRYNVDTAFSIANIDVGYLIDVILGSEYMNNKGFEESPDFVSWTNGGCTITNNPVHQGSNACQMNDKDDYVEQEIENVAVNDISQFGLWLYSEWGYSCDHGSFWGTVDVLITYTDDTTTTVSDLQSQEAWTYQNLNPYLVAGKTIKRIRVTRTNEAPHGVEPQGTAYADLDDFTLQT
jgi:hypothetical protein